MHHLERESGGVGVSEINWQFQALEREKEDSGSLFRGVILAWYNDLVKFHVAHSSPEKEKE